MSKMRKEVLLDNEVISKLQKLADQKGWSLKKTMENILIEKAKRK